MFNSKICIMKKTIITIVIIASCVSAVSGQFTKAGGGVVFGSGFQFNNEPGTDHRSGLLGICLTGIYEITLPLHVAGSFTYFIPHVTKYAEVLELPSKIVVSSMMFDINGHYVFNSLDRFEFYGLAGFNITLAGIKRKYTYPGSPTNTISESDNAFGINVGAGTYCKITEQLDLFGEIKYIISKYDQFMVTAGVLLNLDWLKKHETPAL